MGDASSVPFILFWISFAVVFGLLMFLGLRRKYGDDYCIASTFTKRRPSIGKHKGRIVWF